MKNKVLVLLILSLPLAFMSVLLSSNEYVTQGITAVDCDGPIGVMIFAIPTYFIYGIGGIIYAKRYLKDKKMFNVMIVVFCIFIMVAITPNILKAVKQQTININIEACKD